MGWPLQKEGRLGLQGTKVMSVSSGVLTLWPCLPDGSVSKKNMNCYSPGKMWLMQSALELFADGNRGREE